MSDIGRYLSRLALLLLIFSRRLPGSHTAALAPRWVSWNLVCMRSRRLLRAMMSGLAGVKLMVTKLSGLRSLRGHWGLSGPREVGSDTPREHCTHNLDQRYHVRRQRVKIGYEGVMKLAVRPWGGAWNRNGLGCRKWAGVEVRVCCRAQHWRVGSVAVRWVLCLQLFGSDFLTRLL